MAGFIYPGCTRWQAKFRRWIIASTVIAIILLLLIPLRSYFGQELITNLLSVLPSGKWLPILQNFSFLGATILIGGIISELPPIRAIEFHLFPWFDTVTLRPIRRNTGLLVWSEIPDSPIHAAQQRLREWLRRDIHDGRWPLGWIANGKPGLKGKAFRYALVLGPNGIGKTQMVRELAREFAGRHRRAPGWAGWRRSLTAWVRRVLPSCRRTETDPWDAGRINFKAGGWKDNLQNWRPAAPTILILDDPVKDQAREIVEIISKNSDKYWYSVRLIIIDQFTPQHLIIEKESDIWRDIERDWSVEVISLNEIHWTGRQFRSAVARGLWTIGKDSKDVAVNEARDVKAFWGEEPLDKLCAALDGNPLMLAEAAHWLSRKPFRSIAALLQTQSLESIEIEAFSPEEWRHYKEKVTRQLLRARVAELFRSHREWENLNEVPDLAFVKAMACAALAGEVPLSIFPALNEKISFSKLAQVVPHSQQGMIAAPGSWPIAAAYVEYLLGEYPAVSLDTLVEHAFRANPAGVARRFSRSGGLAEKIVGIIHEREGSDDSALRRDLFLGTATRAMWTGREAVPQALTFLDAVPADLLPETLERLIELGKTQAERIPDVVVALLLLMALAARRFAAGLDLESQGKEAPFFETWNLWLARAGSDLRRVPPPLLEPLKRAYRALCQNVTIGLERLNDPDEAFIRWQHFLRFADIRRPLCEEWERDRRQWESGWSGVFRTLFRLKSVSCHEKEDLPNGETVGATMHAAIREALALVPNGASPQQRALVESYAWSRYLCGQIKLHADREIIESAMREVEASVARATGEGPAAIFGQRDLTFAWAFLTGSYAEQITTTEGEEDSVARREELARQMETLAQNIEEVSKLFPAERAIQIIRAWGWAYTLKASGATESPAVRRAFRALIELRDGFPGDVAIHEGISTGWMSFLNATMGKNGGEFTYQQALAELEASRERFPDIADIQWSRIGSWHSLVKRLKDIPERRHEIETIVRRIDGWASPFPDHLGIQELRTSAWTALAEARQKDKVDAGKVDAAACHSNWIGTRFQDEPFVLEQMIEAWSSAAEAWKDTPGERHRVADCAHRIDALVKGAVLAGDAGTTDLEASETLRAFVWAWVAHGLMGEPGRRAELEDIVKIIDGISKKYLSNTDILKYKINCHYYLFKYDKNLINFDKLSENEKKEIKKEIEFIINLAANPSEDQKYMLKSLEYFSSKLDGAIQDPQTLI